MVAKDHTCAFLQRPLENDCHNYMATTPCYMINVTELCKKHTAERKQILVLTRGRSHMQLLGPRTRTDSVKIDGKFRPHPHFARSNNFLAETSEVRSRKKLTQRPLSHAAIKTAAGLQFVKAGRDYYELICRYTGCQKTLRISRGRRMNVVMTTYYR